MEVYVIRHGFAQSNSRKIWSEIPPGNYHLTPKGIVHATSMRSSLSGIKFDAVFVSEFNRTQETAKIVRPRSKLNITSLINERRIGCDGRAYQPSVDIYLDSFDRTPKGGESFVEFSSRVHLFINLLKRKKYSRVLVVTHGSVFQVFKGLRDNIPLRDVPNLSCPFNTVLKVVFA